MKKKASIIAAAVATALMTSAVDVGLELASIKKSIPANYFKVEIE